MIEARPFLRMAVAGTFIALLLTAMPAAKAQVADPPSEPTEPESAPAFAQVEGLGPPTTLGSVDQGSLLLRTTAAGLYLPAPTLDTEVSLSIRGMVAEAEVRQRFTNPTEHWVEGIYVFPLPENAAVDRLRLVIGDRLIEGEIHERQAARRVYEQAREQGQRAALVEQQRPNLFTTAVANLAPRETLEVRIGFRQEVRYDDGTFSLRFPLAVTPRFEPPSAPPSPIELAGGPTTALPSQVTTPGVAERAVSRRADVRLRARLEPGFELARLGSNSHAVRIRRDGGSFAIELEDGAVAADRDFLLEWQPKSTRTAQLALISETVGQDRYGLLMIVPPVVHDPGPRPPRETIFVIDVSGSMSGPSIVQARAALDDALSRLEPQDHLNVISFAEDVVALHPTSVPASPERVAEARRWVAGLGIRGGTYMLPALEAALATDGIDRGLRQVIFMTDGAVGNEDQLLALIDRKLGDTRLFPVGIGGVPNGHFMRTVARFGRGTFTNIDSVAEVAQRMAALYRKLEQPVLTDLEVVWDDVQSEAWPARIGDLYSGEPLSIAVRLPSGQTGVTIRGRRAGSFEEHRIEHGQPARLDAGQPAAVARLWARRKVAGLRDALVRGGDRQRLRQSVIEVALEHHLVTDFTSLVAVDRTPARAADLDVQRQIVPLPLPPGWQHHPGFSHLPSTATAWKLWLLIAALLGAAAAVAAANRRLQEAG